MDRTDGDGPKVSFAISPDIEMAAPSSTGGYGAVSLEEEGESPAGQNTNGGATGPVPDFKAPGAGADDDEEDDGCAVIQLKYHLSDVKLIGAFRPEEFEIEHTQEEQDEVRELAVKIFKYWDTLGDGVISIGEMVDSGLPHEFAAALSRALDCDSSGHVMCEDLVNCLTILQFGTLKAKVALLVRFMDRNGDHKLSFHEAEMFIKAAPTEICKRLGLIDQHGIAQELTYDALLSLFESSERGEEAISVFCAHILNTLKSRLPRAALSVRGKAQKSCVVGVDLQAMWLRIKHLPTVAVFMAALVAMQMALWEYNFNYYKERGFPNTFCIAKGFGLNLRVLTMFLFLTMARTTMGALHRFRITRFFIPMGFNIQLHSFCGFCTVFHAFGHMFGHIAYHTYNVEGGFGHAFLQKSLLLGASWANKGSGDAITGYILMLSLLAMAATALHRGAGAEAYRSFSLTHFLYNLWMPVLFLHVPHLWMFILPIAAIMIIERTYDFFHQTTHSTLNTSRPCSNGVTFLSVPRTKDVGYPGSYYRIKIPALSKTEWHPFSLAGSVTSHHLTFFVASAGDWTRGLHEIVSDPVRRAETFIQVQGPFYAPAHNAIKKPTSRTLLVASGIGITPFFSIMATKVTEEQNFELDKQVYASLFGESLSHRGGSTSTVKAIEGGLAADWKTYAKVEELRVVWSIRDVKELMFYLDYVYELVKQQNSLKQHVIKVDVYLTGIGKATDLTYMMTQTLFLLSLAHKTTPYMRIHFGRPDMKNVLDAVNPDEVFYCGGGILKDVLNTLCIERKVPFHPEDFDAGTTFLKGLKKMWKQVKRDEDKQVLQRRMTRLNSMST